MRYAFAAALVVGVTLTAQSPAPAPAQAPRPSFSEWLNGVRRDAIDRGVRPEIVDAALSGVEEPLPVILARDRAQAENVLALDKYITRQITAARLRTGRTMFAQQRELLDRVAEEYGVPATIVGGVWGIESNFGRFSGVRPTIAALATLAWDPRRATFFRQELLQALEILNRGDIDLGSMKGSWAGAMGQPQFMPSSYQEFAVDFDRNGRRDIWTSLPDVFASIANYLKGHGWASGQTWGREVRVSSAAAAKIAATVGRRDGHCQATRDMTAPLSMAEWRTLGVRSMAGTPLDDGDPDASLVAGTKRFFLVYPNYDALLEYNCSNAYALTVALLGEQIAAPAPPSRTPAATASPRRPPAPKAPARKGRRANSRR